ncbi:MAG: alpha/beta fold hydrolase [Brevundimonas sp.]|jgi:pimeloyl-ACP methyl ester carboxylesterase|uniref:alpha/beta fold hydrolase n=1 Tax=Brevundimonas sp. TaxID=1871086 RepID=UPI00391BCC86
MIITRTERDGEGVRLSVLEAGAPGAPLVVLIHGFPELAISWSAQIEALAAAGLRVLAPDMRGYGESGRPEGVEAYGIHALVGDIWALIRGEGESSAHIVGHDWGAAVAWHCALLRADMTRSVTGLSVPFQPRRSHGPPTRAMQAMAQRLGRGDLYISRFQDGGAHVALEADPATALRKMFYAYDGATPGSERHTGFLAPGVDMTGSISDAARLPAWMSEAHFDLYVRAFTKGGFEAPLNWYRAMDDNWRTTAPWQDVRPAPPAQFITGSHDPVRHYAGADEARLGESLADLRARHVIEGAGHWIQQERAAEVSALLHDFIAAIEREN